VSDSAEQALRRAIAAVREASTRVGDLDGHDIEDSLGDEIETDRIVDQLDEIVSELDDALFQMTQDDSDVEDDSGDWDDDDDPDDWDDDY